MFGWMRERLINRSRQGDLGEASAIEWLTSVGATVLIPFGHSPDFDLVADVSGELLRIQVKTSVFRTEKAAGSPRWQVGLATCGGNQSWTGVAKRFEPASVDYLFTLVGDGRRWFIPAAAVEGSTNVSLGGSKYSEYEIGCGRAIQELVYGRFGSSLKSSQPPGEYRSGQPGCAVNAVAKSFAGSNPASPMLTNVRARPTKYERKLGRSGQAIVNYKRRVTIPQKPFFEAGLAAGDRVAVRCDGDGRLILERIGLPTWARSDLDTTEHRDTLSPNGQPQLDLS
jgi:hypothetical protein